MNWLSMNLSHGVCIWAIFDDCMTIFSRLCKSVDMSSGTCDFCLGHLPGGHTSNKEAVNYMVTHQLVIPLCERERELERERDINTVLPFSLFLSLSLSPWTLWRTNAKWSRFCEHHLPAHALKALLSSAPFSFHHSFYLSPFLSISPFLLLVPFLYPSATPYNFLHFIRLRLPSMAFSGFWALLNVV